MTTLVDQATGPVDRNAGVPSGPACGIGQGLEAG